MQKEVKRFIYVYLIYSVAGINTISTAGMNKIEFFGCVIFLK